MLRLIKRPSVLAESHGSQYCQQPRGGTSKYICQAGRPKKSGIRSREKEAGDRGVDRTSAGSVVALIETTVRPSALLRTSINIHVILFILHCEYNSVNRGENVL